MKDTLKMLGIFIMGCLIAEIVLLFAFSVTIILKNPNFGFLTQWQLTLPFIGFFGVIIWLYLEAKTEDKNEKENKQ